MRWIKKGEMSYAKENDNKCIRGHLVNYEDEFFVTQEGHYFYVLMRKKKKFYGRYTWNLSSFLHFLFSTCSLFFFFFENEI